MSKILSFFGGLSANIWLVVVGVLLAGIGVQQVRVASAQSALAKEQASRATERASGMAAALKESERLAGVEADHRKTETEKDNAYLKRIAALELARRSSIAYGERLRSDLSAATANNRSESKSWPVACQLKADRLESLGLLAGEGSRILAEARILVQTRDAELNRALDQIAADRAACSAP